MSSLTELQNKAALLKLGIHNVILIIVMAFPSSSSFFFLFLPYLIFFELPFLFTFIILDGKNNTHSLVEGNPAEFHLLKIIFNFYETCEGSNEK